MGKMGLMPEGGSSKDDADALLGCGATGCA
jgi:hypothetical protein